MFEKTIETAFTDPHGTDAETTKHREMAIKELGTSIRMVSAACASVPRIVAEQVVGHDYTLVTRWAMVASEAEPNTKPT